jgi:hypothetical protein
MARFKADCLVSSRKTGEQLTVNYIPVALLAARYEFNKRKNLTSEIIYSEVKVFVSNCN